MLESAEMGMKKIGFIGFAAVFLAVSAHSAYAKPRGESPKVSAASEGRAAPGGELRFGIASEPATLDPLSSANTADGRSILFNVFEGLVKPAPDGGFQPAVAESYEVDSGGLTYTFRLRRGVRFHDGSVVTAEDCLFSLNTAVQEGFNGFDRIEKAEIIGGDALRITLKTPDADFLPYLTIGITPKGNLDREKNPIGTGPFLVERYDVQRSLVLARNPHYWRQGFPYLDRVTYAFIPDSEALLLALKAGSIDCATITGSLVDQLDSGRFDILPDPSHSVQVLVLNNAVSPLDDVRVRRAINYCVDTQNIIDAAFYGRGEPSGSPLIPGLRKYYDESLKNPYPADIEKAKGLLASAGYAEGFPLVITVPSNYAMHVDTAQVLAHQLEKIGVTVSIKLVDWATWLSETYRGRRYTATVISLDAAVISPRGFLDRYVSGAGSNFINFSSSRYDEAYRQALSETDENRRISLYKQAQRIISEEAASVYIQDIWRFMVFPKGRFAGVVTYPLYVTDFSTVYRIF
ncbi:MAG: ABC transporter substrate-binding protein [Spirochaetaceae bacterium]|jgi:peptide/nickel transport system substrate-binding protein|nr:ABC transporter substrate-binding protein [Spirochaetaceae bacterium]